MIRVAHLLPTMEIGGRERIVSDLFRTAPVFGIEPVLVTYDLPSSGNTLIGAPGVRAIGLDRRHPAFRAQLRAALAAERIHVLHAQGHASVALAAGATGSVPMLATMHIALGSGWRWLLPLVRGLRAAAEITAVSEDLARRYKRLAGRAIAVVPTGVDLKRFAPANGPRNLDTPFTIGIAARIHPVKRIEDAVASIRILMNRGRICRLVIAGDGPSRLRIEALAKGCDIDLKGPITEIPAFLRGLDAFLLPSDHEGTPAALLEAMAMGLPCIATRVGGMPALIGDAGILVPRRDPSAIADAIERLIDNASLRATLGQAALKRARSYSLELQARSYADLYSQITEAV